MKTVAIVQARMGASRLPNKMLLHLHGLPVIEWVFRRVSMAKTLDAVVFALPSGHQDDVLAWYLESIGAQVFRGSETDLVDRYYSAAHAFLVDRVVRVCADNPLVTASEIDRLIQFYDADACDYAYNHVPRNNCYPDGLGAEICTIGLLDEIHTKATRPDHREHLFNYIWDNSDNYDIRTFDPDPALAHPELKLDIDTIDDYAAFLALPVTPHMDAHEIVLTALQSTVKVL
jgi:spore coat polysaccharide biosynthesis protein SpsF